MDIFDKITAKKNGLDTAIKDQVFSSLGLDKMVKNLSTAVQEAIKDYQAKNPVPTKQELINEVLQRIPSFKQLRFDISSDVAEKMPNYDKLKREITESVIRAIPQPKPDRVVERVVEKPLPPQIIKEVEKVDMSSYAQSKVVEDLKKEIVGLQGKIKEMEEMGPVFIPAPPIVPSWAGQSGKILTNNGEGLSWRSYDATSGAFYLGDQTTDGSWRLYISDTSLLVQRLESGTWTEKGAFLA